MKFITLVLGLLLVASCTHVSTTSTPVNIDGMWQGEYDSGMDGQPPVLFFFNFTRDGNSLTGFASRGVTGPDGTAGADCDIAVCSTVGPDGWVGTAGDPFWDGDGPTAAGVMIVSLSCGWTDVVSISSATPFLFNNCRAPNRMSTRINSNSSP